jgi:hypothetical protein
MQMAKMKALAGMAGQQSAMFEASVGCFWEFIRKKNFQQNTSIYERWRRKFMHPPYCSIDRAEAFD